MYEFFKDLFIHFQPKKMRREGNLLLVTTSRLELVYLNETASSFIEKADGTLSTGEIVQQMLSEFDVSESVLQSDLCRLIRDLQWKQLISISKTPHCKK